MMERNRVMGIVLILMGVILAGVGLLTPNIGSGGRMGQGGGEASYDIANVALIGVGVALAAIGMWLLLAQSKPTLPAVVSSERTEAPKAEMKEEAALEEGEDPNYLVLRLLNGDEREMYRMVVDAGGEILQKDLIVKLKWSDAKVSRTIDKLIEKRVVSKERFGSTNKVRIDHTYHRE